MKLKVNCTAVNGNSKILINPTAENQDLFSALSSSSKQNQSTYIMRSEGAVTIQQLKTKK